MRVRRLLISFVVGVVAVAGVAGTAALFGARNNSSPPPAPPRIVWASVTGYGGLSLAGIPQPSVTVQLHGPRALTLHQQFLALPRTTAPTCMEVGLVASVIFTVPPAAPEPVAVELCAGVHLRWNSPRGAGESASDPRCTFITSLVGDLPSRGVAGTRVGLRDCFAFRDWVAAQPQARA
jgi:hypothetical protein